MNPCDARVHLHRIAPHAPLASPEEIGLKAHGLLRLARMGLIIPEAVVLGTSAFHAYCADKEGARAALKAALREAIADIEQMSGLGFGSQRRPLLVSVRSGAPVSMPGMMDTLLDVGLCDATLRGLLRHTGNPRLAWDSYRRLVQAFAETAHGADPSPFRERLAERMRREHASAPRELDYKALSELTLDFLSLYSELVGSPFPQDPHEQLETAALTVFASWESERARHYRKLHKIDGSLGTAAIVQRMVFGNAGGTSGAGVGFTRDPTTGEDRLYIDFMFDSQGEDVVSGRASARDAGHLALGLPGVASTLSEARRALEQEFRDAMEFEFTVENGELFMLQARPGKRTPWAALRMAVEQAQSGLITPVEALARVEDIELGLLRRTRLADRDGLTPLARGVPAGLGVAAGVIALDAAGVRRLARKGRGVILVREEVSPDTLASITTASGLLTARGSRTAHAAVVARQMGKPCVVGCSSLTIDLECRTARFGNTLVSEGEDLCMEAESGEVFRGRPHIASETPDALLAVIDEWRSAAATAATSETA